MTKPLRISTLQELPHQRSEVISLIEKAFGYKKPHLFETDFHNLISHENAHHNFILLDENEKLISHIGCVEAKLGNHNVIFLGGLAIDEKLRGQAVFSEFFNEIINKFNDQTSAFILWSHLHDYFKKFDFIPCGYQYSTKLETQNCLWEKTRLKNLSSDEIDSLHKLHLQTLTPFLHIERNLTSWKTYQKIESADLFIKRVDSQITAYFFQNKGMDLTNIIYEWGFSQPSIENLEELSTYGEVWTPHAINERSEKQFQFLLRAGDEDLFEKLIHELTFGKTQILQLNPDQTLFKFLDEKKIFETQDFFHTFLGPHGEDLKFKKIWITGLESV